jgi:hypothetical protein
MYAASSSPAGGIDALLHRLGERHQPCHVHARVAHRPDLPVDDRRGPLAVELDVAQAVVAVQDPRRRRCGQPGRQRVAQLGLVGA